MQGTISISSVMGVSCDMYPQSCECHMMWGVRQMCVCGGGGGGGVPGTISISSVMGMSCDVGGGGARDHLHLLSDGNVM